MKKLMALSVLGVFTAVSLAFAAPATTKTTKKAMTTTHQATKATATKASQTKMAGKATTKKATTGKTNKTN